MKKRILISVLLCVAVLTAGLTGCMKKDEEEAAVESPFSILQTKVASLEGWKGSVDKQLTALAAKPTRAEMDAAIAAGVTIPDLAPLTARVKALETENAALKVKVAELEVIKEEEEAGIVSGKVTVEFVGETPLYVPSSSSAYPTEFIVRIENGTDEAKFVGYDLSLRCVDSYGGTDGATLLTTDANPPVVIKPTLDAWGGGIYYGIEFEATYSDATSCQHILFFISSGEYGFRVNAGDAIELRHDLVLQTVKREHWDGTLTGIRSTSW